MQKFMDDFDKPVDDAAAAFGNFGYETGGFKHWQEIRPVIRGSRGGWGWAQWTGPRRRAMEAYASRNGLNLRDHDTNYKWFWNELKGPEKRTLRALDAARGLEEKTIAFEQAYERAGVKNYPKRIEWANIALEAYYDANRDVPPIVVPDTPEQLIEEIRERLNKLEDML
jgi:hypothetical protein